MTKNILWTDEEIAFIIERGETSPATAHAAMTRSKLNFDDIEDINGHHESHRWGSNADRKYRARAINQAVNFIASHALEFIPADKRTV